MQTAPNPVVSIVVPSRNRPGLLKACVAGILQSAAQHESEIIVVDDGSEPALRADDVMPPERGTVLRLSGAGPAAARNAGVRIARGSIILFTDDDAVPSPQWVGAAVEYLDTHPEAVGVAGPIRSTSWDPLYEQSLEAPTAGHSWTCNIAYRRSVFDAIGGFRADIFAYAHAEDRDLAVRALSVGDLGFAEAMEVCHTPRRLGLRDVARQARWARDDLALYALHPQLTMSFTLPVRLALVLGAAKGWLACCLPGDIPPSLARTRRALLFAIVGTASTAWTVVRTPSTSALRRRGNPDVD